MIEIVIALGITSIGILAVAQAMKENISISNELEKRMLASSIASDDLAQFRFDALTSKFKTGTRSRTVKQSNVNWRVSRSVTETDVERVYLVKVSVSLEQESESQAYASLTTAVADLSGS